MATTSVISIQLTDSAGNNQSFAIDNPVSNLTLNQIKSTLQTSLAKAFWKSNKGYPFVEVKDATLQTVEKIKLSDGTVTITPSEINTTVPTTTQTYTVTVSNGYVTMASLSPLNTIGNFIVSNPTITHGSGQDTITFAVTNNDASATVQSVLGKLNLMIYGEIHQIDIQLRQ